MSKYKITHIVAEWVAYTYEVEAKDEAAALEKLSEGLSDSLVDGPHPVESIDGLEDDVTLEKVQA